MELGHYGWNRKVDIFQQHVVFLDRPAPATFNYGVLNIGDAPFDGVSSGCFSGNNQRTGIAVNVVSTAGYTLLRYQRNGTNLFSIGGDGTFFVLNDTSGLAQEGAFNLGTQFWTGAGQFAGSANGTYLAINAPSGFIGNLVDYQKAGVSLFTIAANGDAALTGNLTATGNVMAATVTTTRLRGTEALDIANRFL